ncbi:MAG: DUF2911 domain-containing protein [Opitutaceae bacterium]
MHLSKNRCLLLPILASALLSHGLSAQAPQIEFPQPSPASTLKQRVGLTDIEIAYSRPGVKDREIFGGLVARGEVWRTGANNATTITSKLGDEKGAVAAATRAKELAVKANDSSYVRQSDDLIASLR